ncbi:hypothetical protein OROGR_018314 [Orobanche gracilis]
MPKVFMRLTSLRRAPRLAPCASGDGSPNRLGAPFAFNNYGCHSFVYYYLQDFYSTSDGSIDQIVVTASKVRTLRLWKESLNKSKNIRAAFRFVPDLGIVLSSYGTSMLPSLVVV